MKLKTALKYTCSGLGAATLLVSTSYADAGDTSDSLFTLEEIVVTAQKRAQSAQDIGLVVNSFDGDALRERGVDEVDDLVGMMANVQLLDATGGGVPIVFIRGVGLAEFRVNNTPAAAFYVDEIYKPSVAMIGSTYFDLERIEVLKGPQGGLYGRNTTAGAVQIISAKPSLEDIDGYASAGYGSYNRVELEGAVNIPMSETIAVRLSGRHVSSSDTYMESTRNSALPAQTTVSGGDEHGGENQWAVRAQVLYQPSDEFNLLLKGYAGEDKSETTLLRPIGIWAGGDADNNLYADSALSNTVCASLLAGSRDPSTCATITGQTPDELGITDDVYKTISSNLNQVNNEWFGFSAIANWDVADNLTLTSITGYEDFDHGRPTDWDAADIAYQDIDYTSAITAFSQEFRLAYSGENFSLFGGVNYAHEELKEDTVLFAAAGLVPIAFGHEEIVQRYKQETDSYAIFGRADWQFADKLNLVFEGRYTWEEKSFSGATTLRSAVGSTDRVTESPFVNPSQPDAKFDDYSGKVALEFAASDNVLTYISLSRGFKSGGFPGGIVLSPAGATAYNPETITGYEAGFKSDLMDNRLRANMSVFYYDYKGLQGSSRIPAPGGVIIDRFQNLGDAEVYGFDAEFSYIPVENVYLQAFVGYSEGEITDSEGQQRSPLTRESYALEGQELNYKPDWSLNLLARYDFEVGTDFTAYTQVDYDWRSSQNFGYIGIPAEEAIFKEDAYGRVNLQFGFAPSDESWSISAFVKNLTNTKYRTNARTDALGGAFEIYGAPRIWGVTGTVKF